MPGLFGVLRILTHILDPLEDAPLWNMTNVRVFPFRDCVFPLLIRPFILAGCPPGEGRF